VAFLTIFTIPKPFVDEHISLIQNNAFDSWVHLRPDVEVLVMGDDPGVADAAAEHGIRHVSDAPMNDFGTPLLDWAFAEAARRSSAEVLCYVNADIVLLDDFIGAVPRLPSGPYLAIGQRWNCDIRTPIDFAADGDGLDQWARRNGQLDLGFGSDYFVYPREVDFGLPPFAVGRPGWDNWMIGRALQLGFPVIDMTPSTTVVHQNHDYGHVQGRRGLDWEGPEADRNLQLGGWLDRYKHSPSNATHVLAPDGLYRARSVKYLRGRVTELVLLQPASAPLRWLIKLARRAT
jgi:hypothetical protein